MIKRFAAVLVVLSFVLAGLGVPAIADDVYEFKYAHTQSENHPRSESMVFFEEQLEERSGGRIQVELYFSGTLGQEAEVLEMVRLGNLQGCRGGLFERANPMYLMYTLPFMFANADQVVAVMNSDLGMEINQAPWTTVSTFRPPALPAACASPPTISGPSPAWPTWKALTCAPRPLT